MEEVLARELGLASPRVRLPSPQTGLHACRPLICAARSRQAAPSSRRPQPRPAPAPVLPPPSPLPCPCPAPAPARAGDAAGAAFPPFGGEDPERGGRAAVRGLGPAAGRSSRLPLPAACRCLPPAAAAAAPACLARVLTVRAHPLRLAAGTMAASTAWHGMRRARCWPRGRTTARCGAVRACTLLPACLHAPSLHGPKPVSPHTHACPAPYRCCCGATPMPSASLCSWRRSTRPTFLGCAAAACVW